MVLGKKKKLLKAIIDYLAENKTITTQQVSEMLNIDLKKSEKLLEEIEEEGLINGVYIPEKKRFIVIDKDLINKIRDIVVSEGIVRFRDVAEILDVIEEYVKTIVDVLIEKKYLNGYYMKDLTGFVTVKGLEDIIVTRIQEKGQLKIDELSKELNLDKIVIIKTIRNLSKERRLKGILTKKMFLLYDKISDDILKLVKERKVISLSDLSEIYRVRRGIIYTILKRLTASALVTMIMDNVTGDIYVYDREIWNRAINEITKRKKIDIVALAESYDIPVYQARSLLDNLIKEFNIAGVWTIDGEEFLTVEYVYSQIKDLINNRVNLTDIALRLNQPISTSRKLIEKMIEQRIINGILTDGAMVFVPVEQGKAFEALREYREGREEEAKPGLEVPEINSDLEYVAGKVIFTVYINNLTNYILTDVTLKLSLAESFHINTVESSSKTVPFDEDTFKIEKVMPLSHVTVEFYLEPLRCGELMVTGNLNFRDPKGHIIDLVIPSKVITIECPEYFEPEKANLAFLKNLLTKMRFTDNRSLVLTIKPERAFQVLDDLITSYNIYRVSKLEKSKEPPHIEAWYFARVGKKRDRIIIKAEVNGKTNSITVLASSDDSKVLVGILSKIVNDYSSKLFLEEQVKSIVTSGHLKTMQCSCGAPLPRLPTPNNPVKCEFCGRQWRYEELQLKFSRG